MHPCRNCLTLPRAALHKSVSGVQLSISGIIGIHAALLHTGKILYWQMPKGGPQSPAILYDPNSGNVKHVTVPFKRDVFCSGNSLLPDGRLLVAGGANNSSTCKSGMGTCGIPFSELFDPISESWANNAKMNLARYYPSNLILPNGHSLTLSGFDAAGTALVRPMEVWDPSSGVWTELPSSANVPATFDLFPRDFVLTNGRVFNAGGQRDTWMFDPSKNIWSFVTNMNGPSFRSGEGAILLPGLQKVLVAGGQAIPTRLRGLNSAVGLRTAQIIDLSSPNPKWVYTGSMSYGRHDLNLICYRTARHSPWVARKPPVCMVTPQNMRSCMIRRRGSGQCWPPSRHSVATIPPRSCYRTLALSPPGLTSVRWKLPLRSSARRICSTGFVPSISAAPGSLRYGQGFTIHTPNAANIAKVVLIGADVTTHADHFEQRFVGLTFTAGSGQLAATAPSSSSEAPAGYYMLFIVNSTGVTSVAKLVQVQWITEHQALRVNRDLLALEGQFLDHLFRLILPQDVVRSGVMRMISASSAIISGRRRIRNQVRLPTDHDIPELRPVLVEFVDQSATRGTSRMFCKRTSRSSGTRLGFRSTAEYKALPS